MKKTVGIILSTVLCLSLIFTGCSVDKKDEKPPVAKTEEKSYQYYTAEKVKDIVDNNKPAILLDIQEKKEYDKHHIKGAIPTYAYPAKTSQDTGKLDTVLDKLNASKDPIVVICPGGAGGATRSIDYLTSKGVDAKKLYILEKGQKGWKYDNLLEK